MLMLRQSGLCSYYRSWLSFSLGVKSSGWEYLFHSIQQVHNRSLSWKSKPFNSSLNTRKRSCTNTPHNFLAGHSQHFCTNFPGCEYWHILGGNFLFNTTGELPTSHRLIPDRTSFWKRKFQGRLKWQFLSMKSCQFCEENVANWPARMMVDSRGLHSQNYGTHQIGLCHHL